LHIPSLRTKQTSLQVLIQKEEQGSAAEEYEPLHTGTKHVLGMPLSHHLSEDQEAVRTSPFTSRKPDQLGQLKKRIEGLNDFLTEGRAMFP